MLQVGQDDVQCRKSNLSTQYTIYKNMKRQSKKNYLHFSVLQTSNVFKFVFCRSLSTWWDARFEKASSILSDGL